MVSPRDCDIDHYAVLGLPSGEQGASLSLKDIQKAYRNQSRKVHPDKSRDDPNTNSNFQKLTFSYDVLKNFDARRAFDARARATSCRSAKHCRAVADLEKRERAAAAAAVDPAKRREKQAAADLKRDMTDFIVKKGFNLPSWI